MNELVAEKVLRAVELIPRGRVVSYGDIGGLVGAGPRQVGAVMAAYGSGVTWWRVTSASGDFRPDLLDQARVHWLEEGIRIKPNGLGCRIADYRADLDALAAAYKRAVAGLD